MTTGTGSPAYRRIAASLAEALERLHTRLAPLSNDEAQRNIAAMHRRPAPAKRRSRKQTQKA